MARERADVLASDDASAQDVDHNDVAGHRVGDERVPSVLVRRRVARLAEAAHDVLDGEAADDRHDADLGVRDDSAVTDGLDAARIRERRDVPEHTAAR